MIVALVRRRDGSFTAHALEMALRERLVQRDIELLRVFGF
jgi:hypothetical protein